MANVKLNEDTKLLILNTIEHGEITDIATLAKIAGVTERALFSLLKRDKGFSKVFYDAREIYRARKLARYNDALDKIALGLVTKTETVYLDDCDRVKARTVVKKEFPPSFDALKYKLEKLECETSDGDDDGKIEIVLGGDE